MKWPWERSDDEKRQNTRETEVVQQRLRYVMAELRKTLDQVETRLERELDDGV